MSELRFYDRPKPFSVRRRFGTIFSWIFEILLVIILAYLCVVCFGARTVMVGQSMSDEIQNGDTVLINRVKYIFFAPKRGDVIVFRPNGNEKTHRYVKRVVGLPGERIQIRDGKLYINGMEYEKNKEIGKIEDPGIAAEELTLEQDEYFVLGDNCENSEDSRFVSVGNVKKKDIIGKAWLILFPRNHMGFLDS